MFEKIAQSVHSPNLETLLCLQTKIENMNKDIYKIQNDTQNNLILKMMEMKDL